MTISLAMLVSLGRDAAILFGKNVRVGIPNEESWYRRSYLPGGRATGWRRTGCLAMIAIGIIAVAAALVLR